MKTKSDQKEARQESSTLAHLSWPTFRFPYWLLVVAVGLVASLPLAHSGYFISDDGIHNLFRLYPLQQAWAQGVFYPRWLPDLGFGYGYPLLDFYEPLTFYISGLFLLLGSGYILATKLTCVFIFITAGLGMYGWARDLFGRRGAVLAAAAYVFAPYFLINIYVRGAFAESLSLAVFPWAFWAARRVAACHSRANIVALAAFTAAIMLSHNIRALLTLPLLALFLALLIFSRSCDASFYVKKGLVVAGAIGLGLAVSSFFWVPALFQRSDIQVDAVVRATEDFHPILRHFQGLVQSSLLYIYPATANSTPILLGLGQALTAGMSSVAVLVAAWRGRTGPPGNGWQQGWLAVERWSSFRSGGRRTRPEHGSPPLSGEGADGRSALAIPDSGAKIAPSSLSGEGAGGRSALACPLPGESLPDRRRGVEVGDRSAPACPLPGQLATAGERSMTLAFAGGVLLVSLLLQLPGSVFVWDLLPLFNFVEFPFRLLGFSAVAVALLAGALPTLVPTRAATVITVLGVVGLGLVALVQLHPIYLRLSDADITHASIAAHEKNSLEVGLGPSGIAEFLPHWVQEPVAAIPQPRTDIIPASAAPSPAIMVRAYSGSDLTLTTKTAGGSVQELALHIFYYPSWQATLDERPIATYPSTPLGLLSVRLPPGVHTLRVFLGQTPLVAWTTLLSTLATGLLVLLAAPVSFRLDAAQAPQITIYKLNKSSLTFTPYTYTLPPSLLTSLSGAGLLTLGGTLLGVALLTAALLNTGSVRHQPAYSAAALLTPTVRLGGYQITPATASTPPRLALYYWRTQGTPHEHYLTHLQLRTMQGQIVEEISQIPGDGASPTTHWFANLVPDIYDLRLPPGVPAGRYHITIALRTNQGPPTGDTALLPTAVDLPAGPPLPEPPQLTGQINQTIAINGNTPEVSLLGYTLQNPKPSARTLPGSTVDVTLYWRALVASGHDYQVFAYLRGGPFNPKSYTNRWAEQDQESPPLRPTQYWQAGEIIPMRYRLSLPATLTPGSYQLMAGIIDPASSPTAIGTGSSGTRSALLQEGIALTTLVVAPLPPTDHPARPLAYKVNDTLALNGVTLPASKDTLPPSLQPGTPLPITLFWQARGAIAVNYVVAFHLLNLRQQQAAGADQEPFEGFYPTTLWHTGDQIQTRYTVPIPANLAPGEYHLSVSLYPRGQPEMLAPLRDSAGHTTSSVELQTFTVHSTLTLSNLPANLTKPHPALTFGGSIRLLGYHLERDTTGTFTITFYWQAIKPSPDLTVFVHALKGTTLVTQRDSIPLSGAYPTSDWQPGEIIADRYQLSHVPVGSTIEFGLYNSKTLQRLPVQGKERENSGDAVSIRP